MDLQAIIGLALIAAALVLAAMALTAGANDGSGWPGFLSAPKRKQDWLRLLLTALVAYLVGVQVFSRFGYTILFRPLDAEITLLYPLVLLGAGSVVALFAERRVGIVFCSVSVVLAVAIFW